MKTFKLKVNQNMNKNGMEAGWTKSGNDKCNKVKSSGISFKRETKKEYEKAMGTDEEKKCE